jgi:phosphoribosyl 1,2-cyclic phosphate phosphodiesterase
MEIKFIGTSNAWGQPSFPHPKCVNTDKLTDHDFRMRSSILFEKANKNLLVDAGPDLRMQKQKYDISSIDALFITHGHQDHIGGLDDLTPYKKVGGTTIDTYAHADTWQVIESKFGYLVNNVIKKKVLEPGKFVYASNFRVYPIKTKHGSFAPGSLAFVVEGGDVRIVYTSDFSEIEDHEKLIKADVLIMEANWFNQPKENRPGHMSFQNSLEYIDKWKPKEVYFTHISDEEFLPGFELLAPIAKVEPYHASWDSAAREILKSEFGNSFKYHKQNDVIAHDGLTICRSGGNLYDDIDIASLSYEDDYDLIQWLKD